MPKANRFPLTFARNPTLQLSRICTLLMVCLAVFLAIAPAGLHAEDEPRGRWARPGSSSQAVQEAIAETEAASAAPPIFLVPISQERRIGEVASAFLQIADRMGTADIQVLRNLDELRTRAEADREFPNQLRIVFLGIDGFWVQDTDKERLGGVSRPEYRQALGLDEPVSRRRVVLIREEDFLTRLPVTAGTREELVVDHSTRSVEIADWLRLVEQRHGGGEGGVILRIGVGEGWRPVVDRGVELADFSGKVEWLRPDGGTEQEGRAARRDAEAQALIRWNAGMMYGRVADAEPIEEREYRAFLTDYGRIPRLRGSAPGTPPPAGGLSR